MNRKRRDNSATLQATTDDRSLLQAVIGNGLFPIALTGFCLALSGGFAILQSASGHLLPHDTHAIGLDAAGLMHSGNSRLLGFMFHDRVAYGGSLLAIGFGYMWLAGFPLAAQEVWAWWSLIYSGAIGFLAFLTYLGQGYLDTWHGLATVFLLPVFAAGLWRSRPRPFVLASIWNITDRFDNTVARWGRVLLTTTAIGLMVAGITIAIFGMTMVFVPSDLKFIGLDTFTLRKISPMLIPVISHDRAGFGGGLCSIGSLLLIVARNAELNRSLIQIIGLMGVAGFGCAIGVHFAVGYLDFFHLLPAFLGLVLFIVADFLLWLGRQQAQRACASIQPGNTR